MEKNFPNRNIIPTPARADRAVRGHAAGPAPPFGNDVADRSKARCLSWGPDLFVATCPNTGLDPWQLARQRIAEGGLGSCMVLPPGEPPSKYRWPDIQLPFEGMPLLVAWAYGFTEAQARKLGREIIESSAYSIIDVRGSEAGPLRFKAFEL